MRQVERIVEEHLGASWWNREHDTLSLRVLLDRLQDEGLSLQGAVDAVLEVASHPVQREWWANRGNKYWRGSGDWWVLCMSLKRAVEAMGLAEESPTP
jgi:hypothetical protein